MSKYELFKYWIKVHWMELIAGLSVIAGAIAIWLSRNNRINNPKIALQVQKEAKTIAKKEALAELFEQQSNDKGIELLVLKNELAASKAKVAEVMHGPIVAGMTDEEIAELYRKSGL